MTDKVKKNMLDNPDLPLSFILDILEAAQEKPVEFQLER